MTKEADSIVKFIRGKEYQMINPNLGGGSFGKTVIIKDEFIDELFVAKKYEPHPYIEQDSEKKAKFFRSFLDEIKILYKLNHKNIVRIFNYFPYVENQTGYIIMEYIDGRNINDFILNYSSLKEKATLDDIFMQLIDGFEYIENHNIIHRDIRSGNILIDKNGTVKIIDFGIGKFIINDDMKMDTLVDEITRPSSLPHEYYEGIYDSKTDMFYLAELFNRLLINSKLTGREYFSYHHILEKMMNSNAKGRYNSFKEIQDTISEKDFINLKINPEDKKIYLQFTNFLFDELEYFLNKKNFVKTPKEFLTNLEEVLQNNLFEDFVQNNGKLLSTIIDEDYSYKNKNRLPIAWLENFCNWYKKYTLRAQELILKNIISKLSNKYIKFDDSDLPF